MPDLDPKDSPLITTVKDGKLIISIGIGRLAWAAQYENGGPFRKLVVEPGREEEWARDVAAEMNREDHDGCTPMVRFQNKMMRATIPEGTGALMPKRVPIISFAEMPEGPQRSFQEHLAACERCQNDATNMCQTGHELFQAAARTCNAA